MEKFDADGIVIKTKVTGESDLIVFVLTRSKGVIRAFAKGARGMKNKLHAGSSLFSYCNFSFTEKNDIYHVNEAEVKEIFFSLRGDMTKMALAQYFCEVLLKTVPEGESEEEYLRLMLNALYMLCEDKRPALQVKAVFELQIAVISGYAPPLYACAQCGEFETDFMYFNCTTGELLCSRCGRQGDGVYVPVAVVAAMRHIVFSPFEKVFAFQLSEELLRPLTALTEKYLQNCFQVNFRLLGFFWTAAL